VTHISVDGTVREINQKQLTSDCWLIQFSGLKECETCPARSTEDCGGGETLKAMQAGTRAQLGSVVGKTDPVNPGFQGEWA
jgi:hypothetical protein